MILVTGGAGYIGSHTVLCLLNAGYDVAVLDNLSNGSKEALDRVELLSQKKVKLIVGDVQDHSLLNSVFSRFDFSAVIHFAGLKSVSESVTKPLDYYETNINGTLALCKAMESAGLHRLIFSSSANVYGSSGVSPVSESSPVGKISNPYGRSKYIVECLLNDLCVSNSLWSIGILRYFNPIGAHESGLIGEDSLEVPNNLVPYITQVAIGALSSLSIYGNNYDTPDGTGVRDYVHVMDLSDGHLKALSKLNTTSGCHIWNLGAGKGYSVLELKEMFEKISGKEVAFKLVGRRDGDIAELWADTTLASRELGWKAQRNLNDMLSDAWRWQLKNPKGYN